jgi:Tol biopolymer transport system component
VNKWTALAVCAAAAAVVGIFAIPSGATREATAWLSAADRLVFSVFHCEDACDQPIYSANSDGSDLRTITSGRFLNEGPSGHPAWSPSGRTIAYDRLAGIFVESARGGGARRVPGTGQGESPRWSPDGTRIVFNYVGATVGIAIVRTTSRPGRRLIDPPRGAIDPDWSPDGKSIAFTGNSGAFAATNAIYVMNVAGGALRKVTRPPPGVSDRDVRWSPDGKRLLFARGNTRTQVFTVSAHGGPVKPLLTAADVRGLSWSPDGKQVAYANGKIRIFDLASRRHRLVRLKPCMGSGSCQDVDW